MPKAQLSELLSALSGSLGDLVVTTGKRGTTIRQKPTYARPTTPKQQENALRMKSANLAWSTFTGEEADLWNAYALTITHHNAQTDADYHPSGYNAYLSLTLKLLQINPGVSVPRTPPTRRLSPDNLTLTLTAGKGELVFTAEGVNSPSVKTELLLQILPNARRKPTPNYLSKGFFTFTPLLPTVTLPVAPGAYAAAYRFVNTETGQMRPLVTLGKSEVIAAVVARSERKAA